MDRKDHKVTKDLSEHKDHKDRKVTEVLKVLKDLQLGTTHLHQVWWHQKDQEDLLVILVLQVLRVTEDLKVIEDHKDQLDLKVTEEETLRDLKVIKVSLGL